MMQKTKIYLVGTLQDLANMFNPEEKDNERVLTDRLMFN